MAGYSWEQDDAIPDSDPVDKIDGLVERIRDFTHNASKPEHEGYKHPEWLDPPSDTEGMRTWIDRTMQGVIVGLEGLLANQ